MFGVWLVAFVFGFLDFGFELLELYLDLDSGFGFGILILDSYFRC